jgi:hypothetical protein
MAGSLPRSCPCIGTVNPCASAEQEYVFKIVESVDARHKFAALSNHTVSVLDTSSLVVTDSIRAHKSRINSLSTVLSCPHLLATSSDDKTAAVWDIRMANSSPAVKFSMENEVFSCSVGFNDLLLAVSNDTSVYFFDIRGGAASARNSLSHFDELHTETITAVKFLPNNPTLILTCGDDGLAAVHDISVPDAEEVTISVMNVGCSIKEFGFFGNNFEGMYCISTVENMSCWHMPSSVRIGNYESIREDFQVDYVVDCFYKPESSSLYLVAGDFSGAGKVINFAPTIPLFDQLDDAQSGNSSTYGGPGVRGDCVAVIHGHQDVIRTVNYSCHFPTGFYTGGEDGIICKWQFC